MCRDMKLKKQQKADFELAIYIYIRLPNLF